MLSPGSLSELSLLATMGEVDPQTLIFQGTFSLLNRLINTTVQYCADQTLTATLWAKLPPFATSSQSIEDYCRSDLVTHFFDCSGETPTSTAVASNHHYLTLEANQKLEREFFLLIRAPQLNILWIAQIRPDSALNLALSLRLSTIDSVLEKLQEAIVLTDVSANVLSCHGAVSPTVAPELMLEHLTALVPLLLQQAIAVPEVLPNYHLAEPTSLALAITRELSVPLTNMKTALLLLESKQHKREQRQRYLDLLRRECQRQNALITGIQELIQLSAAGDVLSQGIWLEECVPGVVSTYQPIAEELGITLGYTLAPALPPVALTATELRSILQHLLHNSLKFTPPQGKVQVRGTFQRQMVELTVTDTGIGIEMADLPKLFNLFFRGRKSLQEEQPGAGLGLTLVKDILTKRGGTIKVNSHPGRGSQFQIFLPVFPFPPSL